MLYNLNNEVTELKQVVKKLMAGEQVTVAAETPHTPYYAPATSSTDTAIPIIQHPTATGRPTASLHNDDNIQDTEAVEEAEAMSLDEVEKEMIKKALDRNRGRRRAAAKELNISERTLYRKIKLYDLE